VIARRARPADAPGLARCWDAVAAEGRWIAAEPGTQPATWWAERLAQAPDHAAVWVVDGPAGIAGFLEVAHGAGIARRVATFGLAVRPADWRRGVATALLAACHAWAAARGCAKLAIACVATNHAALSLYAAWGYRVEAVRPRQYCHDDVWEDECLLALWAPFPTAPRQGGHRHAV